MKHVIIGTAGHVDHGKTLLIKALTGIDTDRLMEEKKRGITIELGFAHLDWPDGTQAGIVDVPGHEKFIKNMLMGAGGIDLAMLVIAADDGIMPQTVEHLDILTLLGIQDGLVVITKADTVDPEWLEMMKEEIAGRVQGTFLEGKPIHTVSAYTGQGIPELKDALRVLVRQAEEKSQRIPFRLPIDRVFSVEGFGTVVTGTLIEGAIHEGEPAQLVPSGAETRIRNLQVHGKHVDTAYAGQRVAVVGMSPILAERCYENLAKRYGNDGQFRRTFIFNILYVLSSGVPHSVQYALAAMFRAASDGRLNYVEHTREYARRAAQVKEIMKKNGFHIVYDKDCDQEVGDGFFFTFGYKNMTGEQLINKLIYYGISAITLEPTGSTREGLRGCVSMISDYQYDEFDKRLRLFSQDY